MPVLPVIAVSTQRTAVALWERLAALAAGALAGGDSHPPPDVALVIPYVFPVVHCSHSAFHPRPTVQAAPLAAG